MSPQKSNLPEFEKIHPEEKFYKHVFYNPDMRTYIVFSNQQMKIAEEKEKALKSDVPAIRDYPSAYHLKSPELSQSPGQLIVSSFFGVKNVPKLSKERRGMSFSNVNPNAYIEKIVMDEEDVAYKLRLGQMLLENGQLASALDYHERRKQVFSMLADDQAENGDFVHKLSPLP